MTAGSASIDLSGLLLFRRGKVRDTYDLGDRLLMVATDRLSAFDVVLPTLIPGKGVVLTQLSRFWFDLTRGLISNHLITADVSLFPAELLPHTKLLAGRSMIVHKAERIDIECVVRAYLAGSAWEEYRRSGQVAGEVLPDGLSQGSRLSAPIFTPAAKNDEGHDVNITLADLRALVGPALAARLEEASRDIFNVASDLALQRGIILADTKFEFGIVDGNLVLIDELLTPDSSRFWDATSSEAGQDPPSFDKQFVRDWLVASGWDRQPPGPDLPQEVVEGTRARYLEAYERLTGSPLPAEVMDC